MSDSATVTVRVVPGSRRTRVGGTYDGALVVRVTARAVDGAANRATVEAVAAALGLRPRAVLLRTGQRHRTKVLEVLDPPTDLAERVERLRDGA